MTRSRLWIAILLAGAAWDTALFGQQQSTGGSGTGTSGSGGGAAGGGKGSAGASSAFGGGATGTTGVAPGITTGDPQSGSSGSSGSGRTDGTTGATGPSGNGTDGSAAGTTGTTGATTEKPPASSDAGAASAFGRTTSGTDERPAGTTAADGGPTKPSEPATTFTAPSVIPGRPSESFTVGQGRLARPRFRFTGSVSAGFDDNVFGAPTNGLTIPDRTVEVVVTPGVPAHFELVPNTGRQQIGGIRNPADEARFRAVFVPEVPATTRKIVIPGIKPQAREASLFESANVGAQVQFASRRTLFTLDLRLGAENTDAKPRDQPEFRGGLGVNFVYKATPRLQWSSGLDASYTSQPDISRINTPTNVTGGTYLDLVARTGLEYRWTPRITSSGSITYHALSFSQASEQGNEYGDITLSAEGRYLFNPRFTLLSELRHSQISYASDAARDSSTNFLLVGGNFTLSRRTNVTLRTGAAFRQSDTGDTAISPYLEMNVGYRLDRGSSLFWNTRYGFEEPGSSSSKVVTLRMGLGYTQFFTPRLRATGSANILYGTTSNLVSGDASTGITFDTSLGFQYTINRRWTFTGNYSFTTNFSDDKFAEYYRNRLVFGFEYQF